jgi:hypothetical protein
MPAYAIRVRVPQKQFADLFMPEFFPAVTEDMPAFFSEK